MAVCRPITGPGAVLPPSPLRAREETTQPLVAGGEQQLPRCGRGRIALRVRTASPWRGRVTTKETGTTRRTPAARSAGTTARRRIYSPSSGSSSCSRVMPGGGGSNGRRPAGVDGGTRRRDSGRRTGGAFHATGNTGSTGSADSVSSRDESEGPATAGGSGSGAAGAGIGVDAASWAGGVSSRDETGARRCRNASTASTSRRVCRASYARCRHDRRQYSGRRPVAFGGLNGHPHHSHTSCGPASASVCSSLMPGRYPPPHNSGRIGRRVHLWHFRPAPPPDEPEYYSGTNLLAAVVPALPPDRARPPSPRTSSTAAVRLRDDVRRRPPGARRRRRTSAVRNPRCFSRSADSRSRSRHRSGRARSRTDRRAAPAPCRDRRRTQDRARTPAHRSCRHDHADVHGLSCRHARPVRSPMHHDPMDPIEHEHQEHEQLHAAGPGGPPSRPAGRRSGQRVVGY